MLPDTLSELDAAIAYASAWNTLDRTRFVSLLAPNARYASQYVFDELVGRDAIAEYLCGKFQTVKSTGAKVKAVVSTATVSFPGKHCVLLIQGSDNAVVVFETRANNIFRFDLCITELYSPSPLAIEGSPDGETASIRKPSGLEPRGLLERLRKGLKRCSICMRRISLGPANTRAHTVGVTIKKRRI